MNELKIKITTDKVFESIKAQKVFVHDKLQKIKLGTNPTPAELDRICGLDSESKKQGKSSTNQVRYIIDKRKGKDYIYVWASGASLHQDVAEAIGIDYDIRNNNESFEGIFGMAIIKDGKLLPGGNGMHQTRQYFRKHENSPVRKYFTGLNID